MNLDAFLSIATHVGKYRDYLSLVLTCRSYSEFSLASEDVMWWFISVSMKTPRAFQQSFLRDIHHGYGKSLSTSMLTRAYSELRKNGTHFLFKVISTYTNRGYSAYYIFKEVSRIVPIMPEFLIDITHHDKDIMRAVLTNDREKCLEYSDKILYDKSLCQFVNDPLLLADMSVGARHPPYNIIRSKITDEALLEIITTRKWTWNNTFAKLLQELRPQVTCELIKIGYKSRVRYMGSVELYLTCEKYGVDFRRKNNGGWKNTLMVVGGRKSSFNHDVLVSPVMLEYIVEVAPQRMPKIVDYVSVHHESIERLKALMTYTKISYFVVEQEHEDGVLERMYDGLVKGGNRDIVKEVVRRLVSGRKYHVLCWYNFRRFVSNRRQYLLEDIPDIENVLADMQGWR